MLDIPVTSQYLSKKARTQQWCTYLPRSLAHERYEIMRNSTESDLGLFCLSVYQGRSGSPAPVTGGWDRSWIVVRAPRRPVLSAGRVPSARSGLTFSLPGKPVLRAATARGSLRADAWGSCSSCSDCGWVTVTTDRFNGVS